MHGVYNMNDTTNKQSEIKDEVCEQDNNSTECDATNNLKNELSALQAKNKELNDKVLLAYADNDNLRRRMEREVKEAKEYSISNFAHDMVEVLENLYRAKESTSKELLDNNPVMQNIYQGIEMTLNSLITSLSKNGVERLFPMGSEFDHNYHQMISQIEAADGVNSGTIVQVLQAGYIVHKRLLRPALVIVAK